MDIVELIWTLYSEKPTKKGSALDNFSRAIELKEKNFLQMISNGQGYEFEKLSQLQERWNSENEKELIAFVLEFISQIENFKSEE